MSTLKFLLQVLPIELLNTIWMCGVATMAAVVVGFPLGVALKLTQKGGLKQQLWLYKTLSLLTNIGRSVPFAILMVALIPVTRWLVGTSVGTLASTIPLSFAAAPFFARVVENSLDEVDPTLIDAALLMGARPLTLVFKVLVPEALPSLVRGTTLMVVNLIGYSAMAGLIGGGGLGKVAIQYGYHRFNMGIILTTLALLIAFVGSVQWLGQRVDRLLLKKRGEL